MKGCELFLMSLMSLTLGLLFFFSECEASAVLNPQKHPIYYRLLHLQPTLNKKLARAISDDIYKCHKKIGIDKYLLTAIYNQESQINYKSKNCLKAILTDDALKGILDILQQSTWLVLNEKKLKATLNNRPLKVCFDLGIGQINVTTALRYKQCSDLTRLTTDYTYNIACSCTILKDFKKRYSHKEKTWWTRYNANNKEKREIYRQLVMRYLPKNI